MWPRLRNLVLGEPTGEHLPERVREAIERQQIDSERLISCAQLLLVMVFAGLWAVSPPPLNRRGRS